MGSMAAEIGLDFKLLSMRTACGLMKEAAAIGVGDGALTRLEESVRSLEEERKKIEAFQRELPLCMHLLTDVIEALKREMDQSRGEKLLLGFEEFIPAKSKFDEASAAKETPDCKDKMNWMSSAQLWSDSSIDTKDDEEKRIPEERVEALPEKNLFLDSRCDGFSGPFLPFKGLSVLSANTKDNNSALPALSLLSPPIERVPRTISVITEDRRVCGTGMDSKGVDRPPMSSLATAHLSLQAQHQTQRKARRCWSPELHRRFVFALQHIGGAQVATPKQIRELMKVDGLTNDEVKSHLQKYRLHIRRTTNSDRPLAVAEGLWASPENYSSSSQQSISQSGSPQSPLQLVSSNPTLSMTVGDSCEEEDGKSECYSWKY